MEKIKECKEWIETLPFSVKDSFKAKDFEQKTLVFSDDLADQAKGLTTVGALQELLNKYPPSATLHIDAHTHGEEDWTYADLEVSVAWKRKETEEEVCSRLIDKAKRIAKKQKVVIAPHPEGKTKKPKGP